MAKFTLPPWFSSLSQQPKLQALGFSFTNAAEIEQADISAEADYFLLGSSEDLGHFQCIDLWYSPTEPDWLYVSLGDLYPALHFPIKPTVRDLEQVHKDYMAPAEHLPEPLLIAGEPSPQELAKLYREAEPVHYERGKMRQVSFYLGHSQKGDTLRELESRLWENPYLSKTPLCLGSYAHDGRFSQIQSLFSCSLYSLRHETAFGAELFFLDLQYLPKKHGDFLRNLDGQGNLAQQYPFWPHLPEDLPLDVLGAILASGYGHLETEAELLAKVEAGQLEALMVLSVMVSDSDFSRVFLPLASHPEPKFREIIAREAQARENEEVLIATMMSD